MRFKFLVQGLQFVDFSPIGRQTEFPQAGQ